MATPHSSTVVSRPTKSKGSIDKAQNLGVASTYANDLVEIKEFTADDGLGNNVNCQIWVLHYSVATNAAALTADAGYALAPNGSYGYLAGDTRTAVKKGIGSGWGKTDGTWV